MFRTVVPLAPIAVEKVGPQGGVQASPHDTPYDAPHDTPYERIIAFCTKPRSKTEIMRYCGYQDAKHFTKKYLKPLLESGQLQMTLPDKPQSHNQKYVTVQKAEPEN